MSKVQRNAFAATYFSRDVVLKIARYADLAAWVVIVVYAVDFLLAALVLSLQYLRGLYRPMGPTDVLTNALFILERPFRGVVYFFALQAIGKAQLILLDVEDNTRRGARRS